MTTSQSREPSLQGSNSQKLSRKCLTWKSLFLRDEVVLDVLEPVGDLGLRRDPVRLVVRTGLGERMPCPGGALPSEPIPN